MLHVQNKISQGLDVLQFFTMRNWIFASQKFKDLNKCLTPDEYKMFFIDTEAVPQSFEVEFIKNCLLGGRQYVLKEPLSTIPRARIQMKMYNNYQVYSSIISDINFPVPELMSSIVSASSSSSTSSLNSCSTYSV